MMIIIIISIIKSKSTERLTYRLYCVRVTLILMLSATQAVLHFT